MKRWLWSLAVAVPIGLMGILPTTAQADRDGGHRHHRHHHRHHGHHGHYGYRYYRPHYVEPYYGYGYNSRPYYRHHHRHGDSFGVYTPWGSFYYYD